MPRAPKVYPILEKRAQQKIKSLLRRKKLQTCRNALNIGPIKVTIELKGVLHTLMGPTRFPTFLREFLP